MKLIQTSKIARLTILEMTSYEKGSTLTARLEKSAWYSYFINKIRRYSKRAKTGGYPKAPKKIKRVNAKRISRMEARLDQVFGGISSFV